MKLTDNFYLSEFQSNDGASMPLEVLENVKLLAVELQKIRDHFNAPITINSGYRSPRHNKAVGGAKNSQHLLGNAADIVVHGQDPSVVSDTIQNLIDEGVLTEGGLGRYNTFTHYDIRGYKARW